MKRGRETTQEERVQIVRECIAMGKNYGEMALKYQVSYQQVRSWALHFEEMSGTARPAWAAEEGPEAPDRIGAGTG